MRFRLFPMVILACAAASVVAGEPPKPAERWWKHVVYLADDSLEGRGTGSDGYRRGAEYVAREFRRAGLRPAGTKGFFQPIRFSARRILEDQSKLALLRDDVEQPLVPGEDAYFSLRGQPAQTVDAPIVFAGYGLTVPDLKYDDLAGLNVRGKIVLHITGGPSSIPAALRQHHQSSGERWKALKAAGAIGVISISNPRSRDVPWPRSARARFLPALSLEDSALDELAGLQVSIVANPAHAEKWFAGTSHTFAHLLDLADAGLPLPRFPLAASLRARIGAENWKLESPNLVGVLRGSDPRLRDEYVVLSAHLDHIGTGQPVNGDAVFNGAMDNAAGIATLIEMARMLREQGIRPRRSLLFVALTAEEKGLLGSRYFAAYPGLKRGKMVANLNVDMFLPLFPLKILTVMGLEESDLGDQVRAVGEKLGIRVEPDPEPHRNRFIRSDQYNFIRRGVPALAFKVGFERGSPQEEISRKWIAERYHAVSDDVNQPVDKQAAADLNNLLLRLAVAVANRDERPRWRDTSFFRRFAAE